MRNLHLINLSSLLSLRMLERGPRAKTRDEKRAGGMIFVTVLA